MMHALNDDNLRSVVGGVQYILQTDKVIISGIPEFYVKWFYQTYPYIFKSWTMEKIFSVMKNNFEYLTQLAAHATFSYVPISVSLVEI